MRAVLYVLLALDCVQLATALAAFGRGRQSSRAGAPSHARYSFAHGLLLLGGAIVLALPVVLGLAHVISATVAVAVALGLEAVALIVSRLTLRRLEAAHQSRRPAF